MKQNHKHSVQSVTQPYSAEILSATFIPTDSNDICSNGSQKCEFDLVFDLS